MWRRKSRATTATLQALYQGPDQELTRFKIISYKSCKVLGLCSLLLSTLESPITTVSIYSIYSRPLMAVQVPAVEQEVDFFEE